MSLDDLIAFMRLLIAFISVCITLIAFRGYLKFRKRRLLFLSAAFLFLAIPQIIGFLSITGILQGLRDWYFSHLAYWLIYAGITSIIAFALLACVYSYQRKNQAIEITRAQWTAGGLLILAEVGFIIYAVLRNYAFLSDLDFLNFLLGSVAYVIIIFIVISLFSYYRAKRTRCTLIVMFGFICLLLSQAYGVFSYVPYYLLDYDHSFANYYIWIGLATSIGLAGYIAFLLALVRPRFLR